MPHCVVKHQEFHSPGKSPCLKDDPGLGYPQSPQGWALQSFKSLARYEHRRGFIMKNKQTAAFQRSKKAKELELFRTKIRIF